MVDAKVALILGLSNAELLSSNIYFNESLSFESASRGLSKDGHNTLCRDLKGYSYNWFYVKKRAASFVLK